jgi:hypothetical protein
MIRGILSMLLIAWTVFMLVQIVQSIYAYGMSSMLLVMIEVVIWYGLAWLPLWILGEMD